MSLVTRFKAIFSKIKSNSDYRVDEVKLGQLEDILSHRFADRKLLIEALTHRSYLELIPGVSRSNERLEFLGDSVLDIIIAESLFTDFAEENEGFLTKIRSHIVQKNYLYEVAVEMGLENFVLFNKKFMRNSPESMQNVMADALESVIAALYLDAGMEKTKQFVADYIYNPSIESGRYSQDQNFKGQLLELSHSLKMSSPVYNLVDESGPEHDKNFIIEVTLNGNIFGRGEGRNKKTAEQEAAKFALEKLNQNF